MQTRYAVKSVSALALALLVGTSANWAGTPPVSVLAAQWWQWGFAVPAAQCPISDTTGEFAALGQSGPVWFLAGTFGTTAERTFSVPAGKSLFFPIVNTFWGYYVPLQWGRPTAPIGPGGPINNVRTLSAQSVDQMQLTDMECDVDGVEILITEQNREQSVPFTLQMPAYNLWQDEPVNAVGCADNGYYVLLPPLARGQHTIHFKAVAQTFALEVTDHITVE
jgi:hypothetical protein